MVSICKQKVPLLLTAQLQPKITSKAIDDFYATELSKIVPSHRTF